jgi:DNA-binding NarL/FixJ family response regulator
MSAFAEREYVRNLRIVGIDGYLLKSEAAEWLITAIRTVLQGRAWYSTAIMEMIIALEGHL